MLLSTRRVLRATPVVLGALFLAASAQARIEVVSWSHVEPCSVERFELRYGSAPGSLNTVVDVGRPRQAGSHFSYELEIPNGQQTWVCVAAIRGSERSDCSTPIALEASSENDLRSEPAPAPQDRTWCDDFAGGGIRSGWVSTGANESLASTPGLFNVSRVIGTDEALVSSVSLDDIHSHFLGTSDDGTAGSQWSAYEYSGQMLFSDADAGVGVTLYSQYDTATHYYRLGRQPAATRFEVDGDRTDPSYRCVDRSPPQAAEPGRWYAFRLRIEDEGSLTTLQAKIWRADKREPEGFQIRCADANPDRHLRGAIGVWATGTGTKAWDSLHVSRLSTPDESDPLGAPGRPELVLP